MSSMTTLVSIIMPAYNAEAYIGEAIESVLSQTYQQWELIIVEDCSTDTTKQIINAYAKQDHRIKPVFNTYNSGKPSVAKNIAIKQAQGEYLAFLDSDDIWMNKKLEIQLKVMQESGYALSYTGAAHIDSSGKTIGEVIPKYPCGKVFDRLLIRYEITHSTVMVKRAVCTGFNASVAIGEDYNAYMTIAFLYEVCSVKENLIKYRVHSSSITKNSSKDLSEGTLLTLRELNQKYNIFKRCPVGFIISYLRALRFKVKYKGF